jgi:hypothetical protein
MNAETKPDAGALRLAAPFPGDLPEDVAPELNQEQRDLDVLCERWVEWTRTRRLYAPPSTMGCTLGQLSGTSSRPMKAGGPDAISSAELSAFHIAYTCQPPDALDRRVFDLYYVRRVKPIKVAAEALGISRKHFYEVLGDFRKRVHSAAQALMAENIEAVSNLRSTREP